MCRVRSVFLCVGGMTLTFLFMIFPGCFQNVIWRHLFKITRLCSKILLLLYPLTKFGGIYYTGITLFVCLCSFVCLSLQSCRVKIFLIEDHCKFLFHTIAYDLRVSHDFDPMLFGKFQIKNQQLNKI